MLYDRISDIEDLIHQSLNTYGNDDHSHSSKNIILITCPIHINWIIIGVSYGPTHKKTYETHGLRIKARNSMIFEGSPHIFNIIP